MRKRFLSLVFGVLLFGAPASAKMATLSTFTLKNGLEVLVLPNPRAPLIYHKLVYKVGSLQDPLGKGGIAHLLEHLMFRGTARVKDGEYNRLTDLYGMQNNASTSHTVTDYYTFSDISKLELAMALEADRLHNLALREDAVTAERNIVFQERLQRVENSPSSLFWEMMPTLLWQDNPPSRPVTGRPDEIKSLTLADVQAFYHRWYQPQNAILLLSGDITVAEAQTLAEKHYGKLKNTSPLPVLPKDLPPLVEETNLVLRRKDVKAPVFYRCYRLDQGFLSKQEQLALLLLQKYCFKETNPFKEDLIRKQKIFSTLTLYPYYCSGLGTLEFTGNLVTPHPLEELVQIFTTAMEKALKTLTEQHLEQAKRDVRYTGIYREDDLGNLAIWVLEQYYNGFTLDEIQNYESLLNTVTVADLRAVWQKVCNAPAKINGLLEKCA
jgi:zinc protease